MSQLRIYLTKPKFHCHFQEFQWQEGFPSNVFLKSAEKGNSKKRKKKCLKIAVVMNVISKKSTIYEIIFLKYILFCI